MEIYVPGEAGLWRGEHEPDVQNAILAAVFRVLLSMTLAPTWELWLLALPSLWATWAVL